MLFYIEEVVKRPSNHGDSGVVLRGGVEQRLHVLVNNLLHLGARLGIKVLAQAIASCFGPVDRAHGEDEDHKGHHSSDTRSHCLYHKRSHVRILNEKRKNKERNAGMLSDDRLTMIDRRLWS